MAAADEEAAENEEAAAAATTASTAEDKEEESVDRGEHYMVFAFQNWSGKHKSIHFVAARYNLKNLSARWIRRATRTITSFLASYFIYVVGYAYDGASENRSWMSRTLTLSLKEVMPELWLNRDEERMIGNTSQEIESVIAPSTAAETPILLEERPLNGNKRKFGDDELPWDMKVAYPHPTVKDMLIFALADFSHAIKKIANSLERCNLVGLEGFIIAMSVLKDIYMACPDMTGEQGK